jgi:hypothetical protein
MSDVGATGDVKFRITANGDIFTDGATTIGSPADLAEMYPSDEVLPVGTVVALGQATTTWSLETGDTNDEFSMSVVRRASGTDTVFGVVSTKPGLVLGGTTAKGVPIALSGRVPVLVTNDNGVIRRGDYLVLATGTAGYAMKQTDDGEVIGRAVSDMQEGVATGTVLVVVSYERRPGSIATLTGLTEYIDQETFATSTSASNQASVFEVLSEKMSRGVTIVREYVAVSVKAVSGYFDKLFAKEIYTDKVCIKKSNGTNVCFTGDEVESLINSNNMPLLNSSNQVTTDPSSPDTGGQATSTNEGTVDNQTNIPAIEEASSTPVQDVSGTEPQNTSSVSE